MAKCPVKMPQTADHSPANAAELQWEQAENGQQLEHLIQDVRLDGISLWVWSFSSKEKKTHSELQLIFISKEVLQQCWPMLNLRRRPLTLDSRIWNAFTDLKGRKSGSWLNKRVPSSRTKKPEAEPPKKKRSHLFVHQIQKMKARHQLKRLRICTEQSPESPWKTVHWNGGQGPTKAWHTSQRNT